MTHDDLINGTDVARVQYYPKRTEPRDPEVERYRAVVDALDAGACARLRSLLTPVVQDRDGYTFVQTEDVDCPGPCAPILVVVQAANTQVVLSVPRAVANHLAASEVAAGAWAKGVLPRILTAMSAVGNGSPAALQPPAA